MRHLKFRQQKPQGCLPRAGHRPHLRQGGTGTGAPQLAPPLLVAREMHSKVSHPPLMRKGKVVLDFAAFDALFADITGRALSRSCHHAFGGGERQLVLEE
jgi:hypothetical protein